MNAGSLSAPHYRSGRPVRVSWQDGVIMAVEPVEAAPESGFWIAPALVDLQVNGYAGVDFQRDDLTGEDLIGATRGLRRAGCSRFLLTLITDAWPRLTGRLERLRKLRAASPDLQRAIAGWHVEGPFLSAEPGYRGAHDPDLMLDPTPDLIRELRALAGSDPLLLTLAPERAGALEAIALAVSLGIRVSLGHTNAPAEILRAAVNAGATGFTHLGNACPLTLDRHDNILWRVLDDSGLTFSLIPDGHHVSPALFRLVHRAHETGSILYVTDAMSAAGAPPGRHTLGNLQLDVGADGVVRRPGARSFAGSALRPLEGVRRAATMLRKTWREVWDGFSTRPAGFMGLGASLAVGAPADFCLIRSPGGHEITDLQLRVAGIIAD
jgi:N-acetylglucosamine-6-phosphate deacetylase